MALNDPYITNTDLKTYLGIGDTDDDALLTAACVSASQWVNHYCDRQFNQTTTSTSRVYVARDYTTVEVDDFHTTSGLVIKTDPDNDGTYDKTFTATDYVLLPFDGIEAGMTGFPYRKVRAVESLGFPCGTGRPGVQVTAQWGWASVPESVILATKIAAAYRFNLKDSPLGVAQFGEALIRTRQGGEAAEMLTGYRRPSSSGVLVA